MTQLHASEPIPGSSDELFSPVAPGVGRLTTLSVNLCAVDLPGGGWVLGSR